MNKEREGFDTLIWAIDHIRRYRKGHQPVGRLQDALDGLGFTTKTGLKPLLAHEHKTATGWHLVFHLPPGISSRDIQSKREHLEEQAGGEIDFNLIGQNLHMSLSLMPLGTDVPYPTKAEEHPGHLPIPLGVTRQGPFVIELADKPHLLIGGNTGSGKTTALRAMIVSLLMVNAQVIIVDLKGGLDFACFRKHCPVVTTDDGTVKVIEALRKECDRRIPILEKAVVTSLVEYKGKELPFIVLAIDEVAELEGKDSQQALNRLVRLSRSAGICVICATQRPSASIFTSTVFSNTRMLFGGRLCFSVPKPEDSKMVLDDDSACRLPPEVKGRAIWQWNGQRDVQCYNMSLEAAKDILEAIPPKEVLFGEYVGKKLAPRQEGATLS